MATPTGTANGDISPSGDEDLFAVTLTAGQFLRAEVTDMAGTGCPGDLALDLPPPYIALQAVHALQTLQEAHRLGLMLPSSAATAQLFNAMVGSGMGEEDSVAALKLLESLSGE